ncbi:MAG: DUF4011 domain-containing protein, partial [Gammaproteobacteria bacterium]|nr:DUF4011 domain-containing protein [Gammaproteobacteria bacterium]
MRNLQWGAAPNDIALHPQSALSIVDALNSVGTSITLLPVPDIVLDNDQDSDLISTEPDSNNQPAIPSGSNITPIINRSDNRDRTMSVNLLTLQIAMDLREKCKRLAVESALVRNRREKQLYLTVGMLHWQHQETRYESPLLFYPVALISEASRNGLGYVHQLYNAEGIPDFNYHLRDTFKAATGITLPEYQAQQSLEAYLEKTSERVAGVADLEIDTTMRLGIASAPAGINPELPESHQQLVKLPAYFLPSLAQDLIADHDMDDLRLTLHLLDASNDFRLEQSETGSLNASTDFAALRKFATQLCSIGLGHLEFQYLAELPERTIDWIAGVEPVLDSELINRMLRQRDIKAVQLMKLAGIIELLDKAPAEIDALLHRDLAYTATPMLFKRAR